MHSKVVVANYNHDAKHFFVTFCDIESSVSHVLNVNAAQ